MTYRIVYMSRAAEILTDLEVQDLADRAGETNKALGITGFLLFDGQRFMQAIEGEKAAVRTLMDRIRQDPRHDRIAIVADGPAVRRKFGDWSMAYKRVGEGCCTTGYLHKVKTQMVDIPNVELQAAFIGFAKLAYEAEPANSPS
jgi:hypothetical protein